MFYRFSRYVPTEDLAKIITEYYGEERVKDYVIFDCATELQVLRIIENNLGLILYPEYATRSSIFLGILILLDKKFKSKIGIDLFKKSCF